MSAGEQIRQNWEITMFARTAFVVCVALMLGPISDSEPPETNQTEPEGWKPYESDGSITGASLIDIKDAWEVLAATHKTAGVTLEPIECFIVSRGLIFDSVESQQSGADPESVHVGVDRFRAFPPEGCTTGKGFVLRRAFNGTDWTCAEAGYAASGEPGRDCETMLAER